MNITAQQIRKQEIKQKGFTLIEILVAATILATLVGGVVLSLNPIGQITKGQDSQRLADIQAVKTAIDLYYNDTKCYPQQVPFGNEWRVNNTVYMKKVPQDPRCNNGQGTCYKYRTESTSSCPQWNVVFSQLSKSSALTNTCALSSLSNCAPGGYTGGSWACTMSGAVNCDTLASASLITGLETVSPTPTATPIPSATPTPTPTPPAGSVTYSMDNGTANPDPYQATIMPLYQTIGNAQSISVLVDDATANVTSVQIILYSDGDARLLSLTRTGGTPTSGTWTGSWQVTNTYNSHYGYDIIATDSQGSTTGRIRIVGN